MAAGTAPALEIDRHAMPAPMIACVYDLVERRNLEGQMIELEAFRGRLSEPTRATP
ncbi:MAG TPA: hypothetical protein VF930_11090 [Stellaceae bacterium]